MKKIIIFLICLSFFSSITFDYKEFKQLKLGKKIKYISEYFFKSIEQYTMSLIMSLRVRGINEPFDFFGCFLAGGILKIILNILSSILNSTLFKQKNYVYNTPDNSEALYSVIKKLNELSDNLNKKVNNKDTNDFITKDGNNKDDIVNNNKNNDNCNELYEKDNKKVNKEISEIENIIKSIKEDYDGEKNSSENALKTIEECQRDVLDTIKRVYNIAE